LYGVSGDTPYVAVDNSKISAKGAGCGASVRRFGASGA
jgi:hypothetical protein